MPYVKCPACECVSYSAAAYATSECCPLCGSALPLRRVVVPLTAYRRFVGDAPDLVRPGAPPRGSA